MESTYEDIEILNVNEKNKMKFFAIFGIITARDVEFLVLISKAIKVATISGKNIYKVAGVKFLTIHNDKYVSRKYEVSWEYLEKVK